MIWLKALEDGKLGKVYHGLPEPNSTKKWKTRVAIPHRLVQVQLNQKKTVPSWHHAK